MADTAFIEITRATFLSGKPAAAGEVYEVDLETARLTEECRKGKIIERPADQVIEPPKPKVRKISKGKPDSDE